ncbi:MAG: lysophospholipid acyltransferase family protein [Acidimicrobiia bacterium]
MPTPGGSAARQHTTPDLDRLPFAFTAEHPGERRRVNTLSRLLVGGGLGVGPTVADIVPAPGRRLLARGWARALVAAADLTLDITGLDNIDPAQSYLVAPLHESFVDVPVLLHLPLDLRFTVRDELIDHPQLGSLLARTGQISVPERPSVATLRGLMDEVSQAIAGGESVVVFPQGSILGVEAAFSPGVVTMSRRLGLPILPIVLTGTHRVWGHPFSNVVRLGQTAAMHILEPVPGGELDGASFRDFERTMKRRALAQTEAPVRRFDPVVDGWWDGYAYTIDPDFPELVAAVAAHRNATDQLDPEILGLGQETGENLSK